MSDQAAISHPVSTPTASAAAEMAANPAAATIKAAREEIKPPEHAKTDDATARVEVQPPEQSSVPGAASVASVPLTATEAQNLAVANSSLVIMPEVLARAEKNLQDYLDQKLDASLTTGLKVTLSDYAHGQKQDLLLSFTGPTVASNASLIREEVVKALKEIPGFVQEGVEMSAKSHPNAQSPLEIHVPQASIAHYAAAVQSLAAGIPAVAQPPLAAAPEAGHQCSGADCAMCQSAAQDVQAAAGANAAPQAASASVPQAASPATDALAALKPAATVTHKEHVGLAANEPSVAKTA